VTPTHSSPASFKSRAARPRLGWARPRFAFGAAAIAVAGATWAALAAPIPHTAPVPMSHSAGAPNLSLTKAGPSSAGASSQGPLKLSDLPAMVARYGASRRSAKAASSASKPGARTSDLAGNGRSGFNLVETDLTPNSPSDERQPAVSPSGALIAFISTGTVSNGQLKGVNTTGKFHLFVMNRDGSSVRQVTGLSASLNGTTGDISRNQSRPSWSRDGNQLTYIDEDPTDPASTQLWIVDALTPNSTPTQRTFFPGLKGAPAFAPTNLSIAFSTNYDARATTATANRQLAGRSIFSVSPSGSPDTLTRLTGDPTNDPGGVGAVDENPAWALVNTSVLFFSSNRDNKGLLAQGRRIWKINADGTKPAQISDPTQRPNGLASDEDDFPATSLTNSFNNARIGEEVAFQTNSYIDASDAADGARGRDLNIWQLPVDSRSFQPQPVITEPRVYISRYGADGPDGDGIYVYNTSTLKPSDVVPFIQLNAGRSQDPEGLVLNNGELFVSDRGTNSIDRFKEFDGTGDPGVGAGSSTYQFTNPLVPTPDGLLYYNDYVFAAAGFSGGTNKSTTALYRFDAFNGLEAGINNNSTNPSAAFSTGENKDGTVTDGCENLLQGQGPFSNIVFVSALIDNKINAYNLDTGKFVSNVTDPSDVKTFVTTGQTKDINGKTVTGADLNLPTGSAWGPDLNGDGFPDLYVCSSGDDAIKVYAGPNLSSANIDRDPFFPVGPIDSATKRGTVRPGTFIKAILPSENNGDRTGLNDPERMQIVDNGGTSTLYVSSFRATGANTTPGRQLNRYEIVNGVALSHPAGQDPQLGNVDAGWITGLFGPGAFVFNNPSPPPSNAIPAPVENGSGSGGAQLVTNVLSSPTNFTASKLVAPEGDGVDRAADREPSFGRSTATSQTLATLVFVSGRRYQPTQGGALVNPSGGDQGTASVTHDIWSTSTQDTTPPALIAQGAGNQQTPVLSPSNNSPFPSRRTAEQGLRAGVAAGTPVDQGGLRFAVVLRDLESGLVERNLPADQVTSAFGDSVSVSFFNADSRKFDNQVIQANEGRFANVAYEGRPSPVSIGGNTSFALNVYDDGPVSQGGHEQEANAVKGDGVFYCEGLLPTPVNPGDYYIDVRVRDRAGNSLLYDRVWGFSTALFTRGNTSDLFVSDYACGQDFPATIGVGQNGSFSFIGVGQIGLVDDRRFAVQPPVESYYLSNPGGQDVTAKNGVVSGTNASSTQTSFKNVDIWRILCRGPVTTDLLNSYRPTIVPQIDPNDPTGKFTQLTRQVASSRSAVIWAAPYAGTTFVGPGTIIDPAAQALLTTFLSEGGRLFLSGRDVVFALTSNGQTQNQFLSNELGVSGFAGAPSTSSGEPTTNQITAGPGELLDGGMGANALPQFDLNRPFGGDYPNLQFPIRIAPDGNEYPDGALNLDPHTVSFGMDLFKSGSVAGGTVVPAYTLNAPSATDPTGGGIVGQRIERAQSGGIRSRAVFFSFGFEAINRRYRQPGNNNPRIAVDSRNRVASFILSYFRTGSISGTVINDANNSPISGFLVSVQRNSVKGIAGNYLARTDANGNYSLDGLPLDSYSVSPYTVNGVTDPPGYFGGTTTGAVLFLNQLDAKNINLRPIPLRPGTISGKATSLDSTDPAASYPPIPNLPVLIVSKRALTTPNPVGFFAALTRTDALGNFSFSQVPSGEQMRVIFNPTQSDLPTGSNIPYDNTMRNPSFGRREIPDASGGKRTGIIQVDPGANFVVNDVSTDTAADEVVPIFVPPPTTVALVHGTVSVNGVQSASAGATVELKTSAGASLSPPRTATVAADGTYSFANVTDGSFQVVATFGTLSGTSSTVTVPKLATDVTVPDIPLTAAGGGGGGGGGGTPTPTPVPTPVAPKGTGPIFAVGSSYAVSFPYETSANAPSRNRFDRSSDDATISITDAFNYPPTQTAMDGTVTRLYSVSQFDTNSLSYIQLADDAPLTRGAGYLLTVSALPTSALPLQASTPIEKPTALPLSDPATNNQFSIVLSVNSSLKGNTLAGNNFIGFGFNPQQFGSVAWDTTTADANSSSETVTDGTRTYSLAQAVGNAPVDRLGTRISLMSSSLTTIANGAAKSATSLVPFGGYFVVAKKDGLILTFKDPSAASAPIAGIKIPANTTIGFSLPYASTPDAASTIPISSALSSQGSFTVYAFNAPAQKGTSRLLTGGDFVDVTSLDLIRGIGYVLVTGNSPVTINTPVNNAALVPYSGNTFSIGLNRNTANTIASHNGFNLIASPFDPALYGNPSFISAKVTVGSKTYSSVKEAAARGVMSARLYTPTTDGNGNLIFAPVPLNDQFLRPYRSYFVQIYKDNVTLNLTAPAK